MSFQVLVDTTTRAIVGVGINADGTFDPGTDPGPGYEIVTLDDSQQATVINNDSAYLCADGVTVEPKPC